MLRLARLVSPCAVATLLLLASNPAHAAPPSEALMTRLAAYAANFEAMKTRASYAVEGRLEQLDGDGKPDAVKEMRARIESDGTKPTFVVVSYKEDGEDKTDEAKKKARERVEADKKKTEKEKAEKEKRDIKMPFLASQRARYVFDVAEVDKSDPSRMRITFVPIEKEENTVEGSAWVDERAGTPISAGFKVSRTSMWIDYLHVQVEFGTPTSVGPMVSKVSLTGKGGILFLRKRFRAEATVSDWRVASGQAAQATPPNAPPP